MNDSELEEKACFIGVKRKPGSKKLYIDFRYNGKRLEKTTGLDDTPENRVKAKKARDDIMDRIDKGTFVFAQVFPRASLQEKAFHSEREGWDYSPDPASVTFGNYARKWVEDVLVHHNSPTKKDDCLSIISYWLLPYFDDVPFARITAKKIKEFILQDLKWKRGNKAGECLSQKRIRNIMIPFREIWEDACCDFNWNLPNPFIAVKKKNLPKTRPKRYEVYFYDEVERILECMDPHYSLITKFFLLTGLMSSELAGIKKDAIYEDHISIRYKVTRKTEGNVLKTDYRNREIPVTAAIRNILDIMLETSHGEFVFTMKNGQVFSDRDFRKIWIKASSLAGVDYRKPYTTRHTFVAWAHRVNVHLDTVVSLMGHISRKMVFEVYGKPVKGLERDKEKIRAFFGEDFLDG